MKFSTQPCFWISWTPQDLDGSPKTIRSSSNCGCKHFHLSSWFFFNFKHIISNWDTWIKSHLFPCSFLPAGPHQQRAFWADSAPFVDTGRLVVIHGNYREPGCRQVKMTYFDQFWLFHLTTTRFLGSFRRWRRDVNEGHRVSSKSPSSRHHPWKLPRIQL